MELISIIVPVYKAEAYLDRCIKSLVDQTYTNLEIILVDDGSPDCSPQICDAWAERDSRIRVIHQPNAGAGAARNAGIAQATGNIFAFVDSDDYLAPTMYAHLMALLDPQTDVAECDFWTTESTSVKFSPIDDTLRITCYSPVEALAQHISDRKFRQTIWNKLYRRRVIDGILFPVGKLIDDEFWTYLVLGKAQALKHSSAKLYAYFQQPESVMHISYSLRRLQAIEAKKLRLQYIYQNFPALRSNALSNLWSTCLYHGQMSFLHLRKDERVRAFSMIRPIVRKISYSHIINTLSPTYRFWFLLSKLHFSFCCRVRNFLHIGL